MSVDGAERRKQRIDEMLEAIRNAGAPGVKPSAILAWAARSQGIRTNTAREHLLLLESTGEIQFINSSGRYTYVRTRQKQMEAP